MRVASIRRLLVQSLDVLERLTQVAFHLLLRDHQALVALPWSERVKEDRGECREPTEARDGHLERAGAAADGKRPASATEFDRPVADAGCQRAVRLATACGTTYLYTARRQLGRQRRQMTSLRSEDREFS